MIEKLNDLAVNPEWYHLLLTTCNTSIVQIVNQVTDESRSCGVISCRVHAPGCLQTPTHRGLGRV